MFSIKSSFVLFFIAFYIELSVFEGECSATSTFSSRASTSRAAVVDKFSACLSLSLSLMTNNSESQKFKNLLTRELIFLFSDSSSPGCITSHNFLDEEAFVTINYLMINVMPFMLYKCFCLFCNVFCCLCDFLSVDMTMRDSIRS